MNGIDILTLALAKSYTDETVVGGGALKGKNCTISDISPITGGNRITFQWTLDDGTVKTDTLDVMDGETGDDGVGIVSIAKTSTSGLVDTYTITLTDGNTEAFTVTNGAKGDPGEDAQKSTLPEASASEAGKIYQYVGETTASLINGYFYKCVEESGSYSWVAKSVQEGGSGGTTDYSELTNKPQIAGTTLVGNKTLSDLGIASATDLDNKVDKVSGKGLSKNDYTDADKAKVDALGTASEKDSTTYVNPGNLDLPTSNAVYQAMTSMLEGAFHPAGNKTVAELTSDLLVQANVGNLYKITDSGVTDANWIGGAGQTITAGQMAVVVYGNTTGTFLFNLEDGINIDMSAYQTKAITPITVDGAEKSNVEDAIDAINDALNDRADKVTSATNGNFAGLDANGNLTDSGKKASDFGTADEIADIVNVYGAKNLIPYPYLNENGTEFRGVTYTVNADRSVTANGTATGGDSAFFILQRNVDNDFLSKIGQGNFILSGCPAGGSLQTYYLNFNYGDAQSSVGNLGQDTGNGKEITIDTDITQYNAQISVLIREGVTVSNLTFYPMLRMASVKDDTYVPYAPTNAKLNEEKMSYADNGVLGAKNLLRNTATSQTVNNVAFTVNSDDKTVNVTRTAEQTEIATRDLYVVSDEDYKLLAGKTLLMTGCPSGGSNDTYYLECYYNDGTGHWLRDVGNGLKITLPATKPTTIKFLIGIKVASVIPSGGLTFKPMIRLASDPDDTYQPYAMTNKQLTDKIQNFGDVILSSEDDMDEKRPMGIYPFTTAPLHSPEGLTYGVLINVINGHTNEQQYVMKGSTGVIYARSLATSSPTRTWTSWFKFTGTVVS